MNLQSAMHPAGPDGERIAALSWLLFGGGGAIFVLVMVLVLVAVVGGRWERRLLGSRRAIVVGGIAFPVVVLTALLLHTLGLARAIGLPLAGGEPPLRIEVVGHQFWWEMRYPGTLPDGGIVTANEIRIPTGRDVMLEVTSADVIHSLWIPALHGKIDMIPGLVNHRRIRADEPGVLRGQCTEFCGAQHAMMAFYVMAQTPEDFAAWLDQQRLPAAEPDRPILALGRQVFGAAGCGGCHAVRGTEWNARIGPDLTHVGSRLSLGAGVLENHRGTLAGWIAGSQDLKPGNRMPSFAAALDGQELRAVAAWLESLK
ncbi:cytochrome c oxidase subunit II [Falsiroseomonas tokyonensis]|uniref:C-type cytochrome n=1 Tax=Falsiroseomonas tokyonensis TaxID=430521 RepID=A0ABV7BRA0_9PROT|nr:c-type cytochrome [Falsiroseomonas tokyonensis]MBU8536588.1 c-type cytochrome [Falsiroseomonas tokyonensis]